MRRGCHVAMFRPRCAASPAPQGGTALAEEDRRASDLREGTARRIRVAQRRLSAQEPASRRREPESPAKGRRGCQGHRVRLRFLSSAQSREAPAARIGRVEPRTERMFGGAVRRRRLRRLDARATRDPGRFGRPERTIPERSIARHREPGAVLPALEGGERLLGYAGQSKGLRVRLPRRSAHRSSNSRRAARSTWARGPVCGAGGWDVKVAP